MILLLVSQAASGATIEGQIRDLKGTLLDNAALARLGERAVTMRVLNANDIELMREQWTDGNFRFDASDPRIVDELPVNDRSIKIEFSRPDEIGTDRITRTITGISIDSQRRQRLDVTVPKPTTRIRGVPCCGSY